MLVIEILVNSRLLKYKSWSDSQISSVSSVNSLKTE